MSNISEMDQTNYSHFMDFHGQFGTDYKIFPLVSLAEFVMEWRNFKDNQPADVYVGNAMNTVARKIMRDRLMARRRKTLASPKV